MEDLTMIGYLTEVPTSRSSKNEVRDDIKEKIDRWQKGHLTKV